jgi:hypothetical protein
MLSTASQWSMFAVNFLALALAVLWTYVVRCYPNFEAARFWTAASYVASGGAGVLLLRDLFGPALAGVIGSSLLILACCLAAMVRGDGLRR